MRQEKINRAYGALNKLNGYKLPMKKAYGIYKLMRAVEDSYQFALGEEQKYLAEYGGIIKEDGSIVFSTPTDCAMFKDKLEELSNIETDIEFEQVVLTEHDLGDQMLTPGDIYNLEGFVLFE